MKEIRAIIIDDEQAGRNLLKSMLNEACPNVNVVAEAANAADGIAKIKQHQPELVFLDIEMPGGDGFSVLDNFKSKDFQVIFTTAYNEYALKAIKYAALDYILKPLNVQEIKMAVTKSEAQLYHEEQFTVLKNFYEQSTQIENIILPGHASNRIVRLQDIIKIKASNNYVLFHLSDDSTYLASYNLQYYADLLPEDRFYRIHRSCIINLDAVASYDKGSGGNVTLKDGSEESIATRRKADFIKSLRMV